MEVEVRYGEMDLAFSLLPGKHVEFKELFYLVEYRTLSYCNDVRKTLP